MSLLATRLFLTLGLSAMSYGFISAQTAVPDEPIRIKVVVVTMFERGEDTGDTPGEFQFWVEREHLDRILPLPSGYHHLRLNKDGVLGIVTGVGAAKAAASVMALGLDRRFDLSKAYWRRSGGRVDRVGGLGGSCDRRRRRVRDRRAPNTRKLDDWLRALAKGHPLRATCQRRLRGNVHPESGIGWLGISPHARRTSDGLGVPAQVTGTLHWIPKCSETPIRC